MAAEPPVVVPPGLEGPVVDPVELAVAVPVAAVPVGGVVVVVLVVDAVRFELPAVAVGVGVDPPAVAVGVLVPVESAVRVAVGVGDDSPLCSFGGGPSFSRASCRLSQSQMYVYWASANTV